MSRMAVIYWSMTGNTEAMANAIAEGAAGAGAEVDVKQVCDTTVDEALGYGLLALGCPAMGAEVLEEAEFEPFFTELEGLLGGKKVALFGSYDWGDGQWMRDWAQRADSAGANVYQDEGLILHLTPDEEGLEQCRTFGAGFANVPLWGGIFLVLFLEWGLSAMWFGLHVALRRDTRSLNRKLSEYQKRGPES